MTTVQLGSQGNLPGGPQICRLMAKVGFWFIQNQSSSPLKVTFLGERGQGSDGYTIFSSILLDAAPEAGNAGGYLDSVAFPYFDTEGFLLDSTDIGAAYGSGQTNNLPVNDYPYPGNQQSA